MNPELVDRLRALAGPLLEVVKEEGGGHVEIKIGRQYWAFLVELDDLPKDSEEELNNRAL